MRTTLLFSTLALLCVVVFTPGAPAQRSTIPNNDFVSENLCNPNVDREFDEQGIPSPLESSQLEKIRIELLERGFDPGFDPYRENTIDAQLTDALSDFQLENELPVTGLPDATTLAALSLPTEDTPYQNL